MSAGTNIFVPLRTLLAALLLGGAGSLPSQAADLSDLARHIKQAQHDLASGNWQLSLARFKWLLKETQPDPRLTIAYQNSIATIVKENPLRLSFGATLLPSSNVSKGSSQSTFETSLGTFHIDSSDDRNSGVGVHVGASATYTHPYAPGRFLFVTGLTGMNYYSDEYLQQGHLGLRFGHEWLASGHQSKLSFSLTDHLFIDKPDRESPDLFSKGIDYSMHWNLTRSYSLGLLGFVKQVDYDERNYNDGVEHGVTISPLFKIDPRNSVSLKFGRKWVDIDAEHLSSHGTTIGATFHRSERNGLRWSIGYERTWRDFDSRFPGVSFARYDQVSDVKLSASHQKIEILGRTPRVSCTVRDHDSTIALYDYKTMDCAISLNYQF